MRRHTSLTSNPGSGWASTNDNTLRLLVKREIEQALRVYMPDVSLTAPIRLTSREEELHIIVEYIADPRDVVRRLELQIP